MATKTSIKIESDVWKGFQAYARAHGRSASKQMEWMMREAITSAALPLPIAKAPPINPKVLPLKRASR
jgi:hypothetical protein